MVAPLWNSKKTSPAQGSPARGKDVEAIEILTRIKELMDTSARRTSSGKYLVPDTYTVHLLPADYNRFVAWGMDALRAELADAAQAAVAEQGYSTTTPVTVDLVADAEIHSIFGAFEIIPTFTEPHRGAIITVHVHGATNAERYALPFTPVTIGRRVGADIVVPDTAISSRHLRFMTTQQGLVVEDLGSTNGTRVNGRRLAAKTPTLINQGDLVMIGEGTSITVTQAPLSAGGSL
ncbi:FhaA domain-containing protein [Actinomyces trachealis]|uniref:FhaA domain-containing protein n=1 Tax=Actinomyces trachealis TaxID=2763540 RepID=UPI0018929195|nr:FhaA domain-containing protein [Actinomyces trachealis]